MLLWHGPEKSPVLPRNHPLFFATKSKKRNPIPQTLATKKVNIALIDTSGQIRPTELSVVGAALQRQVSRDFAPVWGQDAAIHLFKQAAEIPVGFWPLFIVPKIDVEGVNGYHWIDEAGQPFAKVEYRHELWALTASHELLEMLANPYVNRTQLVKASDTTGQEKIYLIEVADPVENKDFGYRIDGVLVSNFYYPSFFDLTKREGVKYDHLGWLNEPRKLLNGGYISWKNAAGEWWQAFMIENKLVLRRLGDKTPLTAANQFTLWGWATVSAVLTLTLLFLLKLVNRHGNKRR